jgi:hypothetical protein
MKNLTSERLTPFMPFLYSQRADGDAPLGATASLRPSLVIGRRTSERPLCATSAGASRAAQSMPPMGAAQLSSSDLDAVAAYVWALDRRSGH